jgi:NAD(P)-dependent dehydrogenase (short-subunit alcohol dehydrogenase family)
METDPHRAQIIWRQQTMHKSGWIAASMCAVLIAMVMAPVADTSGADTLAADVPTILITGSSRGIGLEITRRYAERGWRVIATCRKPENASDLQEIAAENSNVTIDQLDVTDIEMIDALAKKYAGTAIDVLLNNAGISGGSENQVFGEFNYDVYDKVMAVNVLGPLRMAEAFIEQVAASEQKKIINISSGQGSITNTFGGQYFYRASKAALNMVMRTLSVEVKKRGITVGLLSPGFVRTDFTKGLDFPFMITPEESAAALVKLIDNYTIEDTGTFVRHTGEPFPW